MRSRATNPHTKKILNQIKNRVSKTPTIDFLKHIEHALDVIMVQEPRFAVLLVLFEGYTERVGDVYSFSVVLTQEDTYDSFVGVTGDGAGMVVCDGEEDEWVDDDCCPCEG
jgi:hypothetical protein